MNKKWLVVFFVVIAIAVVLFISNKHSSPNTIEEQIVRWASKNCDKNQSCEIKIADITKFDWDTMYYFEVGMTQNDVAKIMNVPVENYTPGYHTIVFVKDGQVVYTEYFPTDIEGYKENEVVFGGVKDNYGKYDANTIFRVGKNQLTSRHYYELEPKQICDKLASTLKARGKTIFP